MEKRKENKYKDANNKKVLVSIQNCTSKYGKALKNLAK